MELTLSGKVLFICVGPLISTLPRTWSLVRDVNKIPVSSGLVPICLELQLAIVVLFCVCSLLIYLTAHYVCNISTILGRIVLQGRDRKTVT